MSFSFSCMQAKVLMVQYLLPCQLVRAMRPKSITRIFAEGYAIYLHSEVLVILLKFDYQRASRQVYPQADAQLQDKLKPTQPPKNVTTIFEGLALRKKHTACCGGGAPPMFQVSVLLYSP